MKTENGNNLISDIQKQVAITSEDISVNNINVKKLKYDFGNILSKNSRTVGWVNVKNTNINYPVVKYTDNDYYLNHSFDNTENSAGWIFANYQNKCDGSDYNTVIYGHNRRDKSMFGSLKNVLQPEWLSNEDNLYINFSTLNDSHIYKIFSTIICSDTDVNKYINIDFFDENDFKNYIMQIKDYSTYNFNTNLTNAKQIITLYTCHGTNNQRLLVYAVLID